MAADEPSDDALSAGERRVLELLEELRAVAPPPSAVLTPALIRRLRAQQDNRAMLLCGTSLLTAVGLGLAGLFPPRRATGSAQ